MSRTPRQAALLRRLILSSAFSADEAERTTRWLESPACTVHAAARLIDRALRRIELRDAAKRAADERQTAFRTSRAATPHPRGD